MKDVPKTRDRGRSRALRAHKGGTPRRGLQRLPTWSGGPVTSVLGCKGREYGCAWSRSRCIRQDAFRITNDRKSLLSQTEAVQTSGLVHSATLWGHLELRLFLPPPFAVLVSFYSPKMAVSTTGGHACLCSRFVGDGEIILQAWIEIGLGQL